MLIKDLQSGTVRKYGSDCHDSLAISQDGKTLSYYNLQCGDGSRYGDFRFVLEDGEVPIDSNTPDAMNCECYFNIGGFDRNLADHDKQIRDEVIEEIHKRLEEEIRTNPKVIYVDNQDYLSVARGSVLEVIHDTLEQMKGE